MAKRSTFIAQAIVATAAAIAMLYFMRGVVVPLVLAFVLAVLVNALVRLIGEHSRLESRWAVLICAHFPQSRWATVLLSNDGHPELQEVSRSLPEDL